MISELARYPSWSEPFPIVRAGPTGSFRSLSPARSCSEASLFCSYVRFQQSWFWPVSELPRLGPQTL
ncbi:hypothetical protein GGP44_003270 [Salinibacter ruber]|nr:hypothetical protein [Salinibacter ruber]